MARESGDEGLCDLSYPLLFAALLESGDFVALDSELAILWEPDGCLSPKVRDRLGLWFRSVRTLIDGHSEVAEELIGEVLASDPERQHAQDEWLGQLSVIRWMQGRVDELEPYYLALRQRQPEERAWTAVLSWIWARQGRLHSARGALEAVRDLDAMPANGNWLFAMCLLAETSIALGDSILAYELRDRLLPYSRRLVPIGKGTACWGTVANSLGRLAVFLALPDEALNHVHTATAMAARAGAQPWLVLHQLDLVEMQLSGGNHREDVVAMAAEALMGAKKLGFRPLLLRAAAATEALASHGILLPAETSITPSAAQHLDSSAGGPRATVFGTFQLVDANGRIVTWRSRKARQLLKLLISKQGTPATKDSLADALWPDQDSRSVANRLAVAIATVRRALDPERRLPSSHYVQSTHSTVRLHLDHLEVDTEVFLAAAASALSTESSAAQLEHVARLYGGDAFADEPHSDWAEALRRECRFAQCSVLHAIASTALTEGRPVKAAESFHELLSIDPWDERAHRGLIDALVALEAHGEAQRARERYRLCLAELDLG